MICSCALEQAVAKEELVKEPVVQDTCVLKPLVVSCVDTRLKLTSEHALEQLAAVRR